MPIYDYHCDRCGHAFSAVRSFSDETVGPACPKCGATPRRLITAPAIVFKGSGWYKTDSRGSSPAVKDDASKAGASKDAAPKDGPSKTEAAKSEAATRDGATSSAKKPPAGEAAS